MKAGAFMAVAIAASMTLVAGEPAGKSVERQRVAMVRANAAEVTPEGLMEALVIETNRVRLQYGRRPLRAQGQLNAAAEDQAKWMAMRLGASHYNPLAGRYDVSERVHRHGYNPTAVAENVASQPAVIQGEPSPCVAIAARLVEAWMNSPGHRANLLNPAFTRLGCAARVASGFNGVDYVFGAQVFSTTPSTDELRF